LSREHGGAETGREAAREQAGRLERSLAVDLRERDLGHDRVLGESRGAHEVADRLAVAREARGAVGAIALVLLLAGREAEVRARASNLEILQDERLADLLEHGGADLQGTIVVAAPLRRGSRAEQEQRPAAGDALELV